MTTATHFTSYTRRRAGHLVSMLLAAVLFSQGALAQATSKPAYGAEASKLSHADKSFMDDVAHANLAEIEAAHTAAGKSGNADVKAFARSMVDDHTTLNKDLAQLASSKNYTLPTEPSLGSKAKLKALAMRDGTSFDKHYVKSMGVDAHEDAIKRFQKESKDGMDDDVKAFAVRNMPVLEHHLSMSNDLKIKVDQLAK